MAARKPRKTASAARIRVHTDEYGRKVYSIVGTKKFAYTLAKAKEIASKTKKRKSSKSSTAMTVSSRKPAKRPAKRTTAKRGGAKRNAKGQFVKRGSKKTPVRRNTESRASRLAKRRTSLVQQNAMYDVFSNLYTEGMVWKKTGRPVARKPGRSVGEAEGKAEAIRIAEAYIDDQGMRGLLYREDIGNTVIYRGKKDSGLGGMIEIYPMDDREILQKEAVFQAGAAARRRAMGARSNRRR